MLKTTFPAPRAQADALLALTDAYPELSLDVAEHPTQPDSYLYTFFLPETLRQPLEQALTDNGLRITGYEPVPTDVDYVALTRANFPPLAIGPFYITRNNEPAPANTIPIAIAPNRAFGSGEHATTTGCLLAYHHLAQTHTYKQGLDFGAGSSILAIAAAKLQNTPSLCVEIDAPSVEICAQNAILNGVENLIESLAGNTPPANQTFDLIFANILLQPLLELAPALVKALTDNGSRVTDNGLPALILSGFTVDQAPQIEAAYTQLGLQKTWQHVQSGWHAHIYQPAT